MEEHEPTHSGRPTRKLVDEWYKAWLVAEKIVKGEELSEQDEGWMREISEATGWRLSDVLDELRSVGKDPAERAERYYSLYIEYLKEAENCYELGDYRQAGEKLYGAVLALIKYFAAVKGVPLIHWSRGEVEKFITSNVEYKLRKLFRDLLDKTQPLHEHFYEAHLDEQTFKERWGEALELLERAHDHILRSR